jgi:hypothetical protein
MRSMLLGLARLGAVLAVLLGAYRMAFASTNCGTSFTYDAATKKYNAMGFPCAAIVCDTGGSCMQFSLTANGKQYYNCWCPIGPYGGPYQPLIDAECAPAFATSDGDPPSGGNVIGGSAQCFNSTCSGPKTCHFTLVPVNPPPGYTPPAEDTLPPTFTGAPDECRYFTLTCSCH